MTEKTKAKPRPKSFDEALFRDILARFSAGESVHAICESAKYPEAATFFAWISEDKQLAGRFAEAKESHADAIALDTLRIADGVNTGRAANQLKARHWLAAKLAPDKYGDKLQVQHEHRISLVDALNEARSRLASRPINDQQEIIEAQVIEVTAIPAPTPTDK